MILAVPLPTDFYPMQVHVKAQVLCSWLSNPSEADARVLATLFPSSRPVKRMSSDVFDPLASCVASAQERKKKAVHIKPHKVTVVLLSRGATVLACFGRRRALKNEGNIRQLQFVRNMSPEQVRRAASSTSTALHSHTESVSVS